MRRLQRGIDMIFEKEQRVYCMIAILSVVFMMFYSAFSSPLYPGLYAWDASIFMLGGKIIANGGVLYLDYFDQKGPILFFIHALGYGFFRGGKKWSVYSPTCFFLHIDFFYV